ncbi:hypothetical protein BD779DRAFT_1678745 [Infundibulicybe gibba]|nr:hypothetical protein BD779DRAFT_1678745 [Infundibulicybe gibba]
MFKHQYRDPETIHATIIVINKQAPPKSGKDPGTAGDQFYPQVPPELGCAMDTFQLSHTSDKSNRFYTQHSAERLSSTTTIARKPRSEAIQHKSSSLLAVVFVLSIIFVIHPISVPIPLPSIGTKRLSINLTTAPILAIAVLWAAQCLGPNEIRDGIVGTDGVKPYNILILFFSLAYMAITLDITGVLQSAAFWVSNRGGSNGWKLFFYFYVMLTVLSVILGNDPVILSELCFWCITPKFLSLFQLEPISWLMSEFAAANTASMVLFVGNPTNVVICEGFSVNNAAFTAYTILPFLGCSVACYLALAFQFRSPKYLPRRLAVTEELDVRSVLLDPIGAWVGSIILGTCLVVIIVVSFFHVDVWKISLPFAVAKFAYDIAWDHYRFTKKVPIAVHLPTRMNSGPDTVVANAETERVTSLDLGSMDGGTHKSRTTTSESNQATLADVVIPPQNPITYDEPGSLPIIAHSRTVHNRVDTANTLASEPYLHGKSSDLHRKSFLARQRGRYNTMHAQLSKHFPTFFIALPRLPFALVPFAFSQFILIEGLAHQGWIEIFARWLVRAANREIFPTIWIIGVLGVIMCNISGTNIGATILLTKVVRAANYPPSSNRAAAISLAVASNIGAVSFTFSASLAGLLWRGILKQKNIIITQKQFAKWNLLPLTVMTVVGLGIVCAEMAVLY